jgi:hypothetical protein
MACSISSAFFFLGGLVDSLLARNLRRKGLFKDYVLCISQNYEILIKYMLKN